MQAENLVRVGESRERFVGLFVETLKIDRENERERTRDQGHERSRCEGGGTASGRSTRRRRNPRGDRAVRELTPLAAQRIPVRSKALKDGHHAAGVAAQADDREPGANVHEGIGHRRDGAAALEEQTPEGKIPDVAAG